MQLQETCFFDAWTEQRPREYLPRSYKLSINCDSFSINWSLQTILY